MFYHIVIYHNISTINRVTYENTNNVKMCVLFVFLYDTVMTVAEATETCW